MTPCGGASIKPIEKNPGCELVVKDEEKIGAVMVVGSGIAGIQASLDLANSGMKVYLVEKGISIGGVMAQLDKTFPTNDCSACILSPNSWKWGDIPMWISSRAGP